MGSIKIKGNISNSIISTGKNLTIIQNSDKDIDTTIIVSNSKNKVLTWIYNIIRKN